MIISSDWLEALARKGPGAPKETTPAERVFERRRDCGTVEKVQPRKLSKKRGLPFPFIPIKGWLYPLFATQPGKLQTPITLYSPRQSLFQQPLCPFSCGPTTKTKQKRDCPQRSESSSVDGTVPFLAGPSKEQK